MCAAATDQFCLWDSNISMSFSGRSEWSDIWVTVQSIEEFLVVCLGDTFQYTMDNVGLVVCESKLPFGHFLTLI